MNFIMLGLTVSFLWGLIPILDKYILASMTPQVFLFMYMSFIFACALLFFLFNHKEIIKKIPTVKPSHVFLTAATASCSFLGVLLYLFLLKDNDSHLVSAISYSAPMFTLLLAIFILKEKPSLMSTAGIAFIIMGVWCVAMAQMKK
jgi:drug/metabolite transporter (DMT)-like permease